MKTTKKAYVAPVVDVVTMVPEQMMAMSDPNQMSIKDDGISGIENFDPQSNKNVWEDLW